MVGNWDLKVDGHEFVLKPKQGDNLKLMKIMGKSKDSGEAVVMEEFLQWMKTIMEREVPPTDDDDRKDMELFVENNIVEFLNQTLVAFKWTTPEALKEAGTIKKKMESQAVP